MPKVSVCCSVLNQSGFLLEMIASVIAQTYQDWELIIIDDGSTEPVKSVIDKYDDPRIIYERFPENKGIPWGINRAFEMATGEYVQAIAADERLEPSKLELQVAYLDSHPDISCVWGLPQYCGATERRELGERPLWEQYAMKAHNRSREAWIKTLLLLDSVPLGSCSALFRRELFDDLGYFKTDLTAFVDWEWYVRFFSAGYEGHVMPYRFALCTPHPDQQSGAQYAERNAKELAGLREVHKIQIPQTKGKVTIGIACRNMAHFIKDSIDSIIAQTSPDWELIILDDASTDNLNEVLAQYQQDSRISLLKFDENRGAHEAWNQIAARASGLYYVPMSADDTLSPTFIERCLENFKADPFCEFVASQTDFKDEKLEPYADKSHPFFKIPKVVNHSQQEWLQQLYHGNQYFGAGMYRLQAYLQCGGRKKEFGVISDYELYLNILQRGNIRIIEEDLTHTRIHGNNMSLLSPDQAVDLKRLYHEAKRPYFQPRMKVILATPFYEMKGFSPYISSMCQTIKMLTQLGIEHEFWELSGDSYVHRARNTICAKFLEDPAATDLFFIDSDMQWNWEALLQMLLLPEEVVGASYPLKNNFAAWTSFPTLVEDKEDGKSYPEGRQLSDGSALIKAQVLAGGFLRIKRAALLKFAEFYPNEWYHEQCADPSNPNRRYVEFFASRREGNQLYGEDMLFSRKLKEMGMDIWIYTNVNMGHYGVKGWQGNYDQFLKGRSPKQESQLETVH